MNLQVQVMPKSEFMFLQVRAYAIVFVVLYAVFILLQASALFSLVAYGVSALPIGIFASDVLALLIGIATGYGTSYFTQKKILRGINEKGEFKGKTANSFFYASFTLLIVLLSIVNLNLLLSSSTSPPLWILYYLSFAFFVLLISFVPAFYVQQYYSIKQWQQKNHKELLIQRGRFSSKIYIQPHAPN
jgi:hypothetical protein